MVDGGITMFNEGVAGTPTYVFNKKTSRDLHQGPAFFETLPL
jgi:hypothetical protein